MLLVDLWSRTYFGYYGEDYESGLDVINCHTFKRHKAISEKAWARKHYRAKGKK